MSRTSSDEEKPRPILWPAITPEETADEWESLREWVERLRLRFPYALRLPDCWWRHNDIVEALSALRDFERTSYDPSGSATGPVEWHRAFRDIEWRIEVWVKKLTCTVAGRGHDDPTVPNAVPAGWDEFVEADKNRRVAKRDGRVAADEPTAEMTKSDDG